MSEYLGIKVIKKEGTENTFEVTINEKSPLKVIPNNKGVSIEDTILYILNTAQQNAHDQLMKITY